MNFKHYRAVFYAGDAAVHSHDFYLSANLNFDGNPILLEFMEEKEELQKEYGCPVSLKVFFIEERPAFELRRRWRLAQIVRRFSSLFGL